MPLGGVPLHVPLAWVIRRPVGCHLSVPSKNHRVSRCTFGPALIGMLPPVVVT